MTTMTICVYDSSYFLTSPVTGPDRIGANIGGRRPFSVMADLCAGHPCPRALDPGVSRHSAAIDGRHEGGHDGKTVAWPLKLAPMGPDRHRRGHRRARGRHGRIRWHLFRRQRPARMVHPVSPPHRADDRPSPQRLLKRGSSIANVTPRISGIGTPRTVGRHPPRQRSRRPRNLRRCCQRHDRPDRLSRRQQDAFVHDPGAGQWHRRTRNAGRPGPQRHCHHHQ